MNMAKALKNSETQYEFSSVSKRSYSRDNQEMKGH